jgi:lipopolysaccharide biosynthesis glycosyltransferase
MMVDSCRSRHLPELEVVFVADRHVVPGLHVVAHSVLARHQAATGRLRIHVLTDVLAESDERLLHATLSATGRPFTLIFYRVDGSLFSRYQSMHGNWAAYFRLLAPNLIDAERLLYLDVDMLCCCDVAELAQLDLCGKAAAFVAESTIRKAADQSVAASLPPGVDGPYLNSGLMLVDVAAWRRDRVTERAIEHLESRPTSLYDQSTLNVVLYSNWLPLDPRFNYPPNFRCNWPSLRRGEFDGKILHFMANPKPWNFLGEFLHPHHHIWGRVLRETALASYRSWHTTPARRFPTTLKALTTYRRPVLDCILYRAGGLGEALRTRSSVA